MNERGCYCETWEKNSAHFESKGLPRGYWGFCQVCQRPGHTRHFPGAVGYTGSWCDYHYRLLSLIHPLGFPGAFLYFGAASAAIVAWLVLRQ
jgi:hypothetical protein